MAAAFASGRLATDMDKAVPLITIDEEGKLTIEKDAAEILANVPKPIDIIVGVGKYRIGKSFLMNYILDNRPVFELGSTTTAKTKGIWVWVGLHPRQQTRTLLVLDTEGLHDIERVERVTDMKIFALALLMSSVLIYNCQGHLDRPTLSELHLFTQLTETIATDSSRDEDGVQLQRFFPKLFIVLRDFFLEIEEGQTPDEYLLSKLKTKRGTSRSVMEYNMPRRCITEQFNHLRCFTLPRPANEDDILHLQEADPEVLCPSFVQNAEELKEALLEAATGHTINGASLNGYDFVKLLEQYVAALNQGTKACIGDAVSTVFKAELDQTTTKVYEIYKEYMESNFSGDRVAEPQQFNKVHVGARDKALALFPRLAELGADKGTCDLIRAELEDMADGYRRARDQKKEALCREAIAEYFDEKKISDFVTSGGSKQLENFLEMAETQYLEKMGNCPVAIRVLQGHIKDTITPQTRLVKLADEALTKEREQFLQRRTASLSLEGSNTEGRAFQQQLNDSKAIVQMFCQSVQDVHQSYIERCEAAIRSRDEMIRQLYQDQVSFQEQQLQMVKQDLEQEKASHSRTMDQLRHCLQDYNNKIEQLRQDVLATQQVPQHMPRLQDTCPDDDEIQPNTHEIRPDDSILKQMN